MEFRIADTFTDERGAVYAPKVGAGETAFDRHRDRPQQFPIYQSEDGATRIDVMLEAGTRWRTIQLFGYSEQLPLT